MCISFYNIQLIRDNFLAVNNSNQNDVFGIIKSYFP